MTASIPAASKAKGARLSISSDRDPWKRPQSTRTRPVPCRNSMHEPVTVRAAPWNAKVRSSLMPPPCVQLSDFLAPRELRRIQYVYVTTNRGQTMQVLVAQMEDVMTEASEQQRTRWAAELFTRSGVT